MRRILSAWLICLLCISLFACADDEASEVRIPVKFYYHNINIAYNSEQGVISAEIREAAEHQNDYEYLIQQYLQGPTGDLHHSTFPAGTYLRQFTFEGTTVKIILSNEFSTLTGHDLSIACAALTKTLQEMTKATTIEISASEGKLGSANTLTFGPDDFLYFDNSYSITDES